MSDVARRERSNTVADYESFVAARPDEERWELVGGVLFLMTNPTETHEQIVGGIYARLRIAMETVGCRVYAGGLRLQRTEDRGEDTAAIPDIVVRCGLRRDRDVVTDPAVVVEVLSRSTMRHDRGAKFDFYRSLPTLRHIALVYQGQMRVEHYRRGPDGWVLDVLSRPSDRLVLDAVDVAVDLDTVYFDVPVPRPIEAPGLEDGEAPTLIP